MRNMYRHPYKMGMLISQVFGGVPPHIRTRIKQMADHAPPYRHETPSWEKHEAPDIPDIIPCPTYGFIVVWKEWGEVIIVTDDFCKNKNTLRVAVVEYVDQTGNLGWELYERKS